MDKMRKAVNKRIVILTVLLVLSLLMFTVSVVFAFYNSNKKIENTMQTQTSKMVLNEIFNEKDHWLVGETKQKEVDFENTGEIEQLVRFTFIPTWLEQNTDKWVEWEQAEDNAVKINYTKYLSDEWTKIGEYYYYNTTLSPNTKTNIIMDSLTFSNKLDNGGYGSFIDYSNKKYSLTIKMEAIEVSEDVASFDWKVDCSINGNSVSWSKNSTN